MFHGLKFLQIQQFALEQSKKVFYHGIVQTVSLSAHALVGCLFAQHLLISLVLVLPALVRMENEVRTIRNLLKSRVQHGDDHAQHRTDPRWYS